MDNSISLPWAWIDGSATPAVEAKVSIFDRSFLYGDGLFETLRLHQGQPFLWDEHWRRLEAGANFLGIVLPYDSATLRSALRELLRLCGQYEVSARIQVSRGVGPRGYSPRKCDRPTMVLTLHSVPSPASNELVAWKLASTSYRQPAGDRLAAYKNGNKLVNILAKREAEQGGADEAVLLNTSGHITETASCNIFWIEAATVHTPPVALGALAGVTREFVAQLARNEGWEVKETEAGLDRLQQADGVFLTTSGLGIVEAIRLDGQPLRTSPIVGQLWEMYKRVVEARE